MRKSLCLFGFIFILSAAGCASLPETEEEVLPAETALFEKKQLSVTTPGPLKITNHSYLTDENIGQEFTITGTLHSSEQGFSLIENETSRSRVTFHLEIPEELNAACSALSGQRVTVSGTLLSVQSTWTKTLKISELN